jgi:uncharacterized protein
MLNVNRPQLPVSTGAGQRFELIDIMRGYALFGIFLVHILGNYAGWTPDKQTALSLFRPLDTPLQYLNYMLAQNTFRPLFSFLFGLSFYLQLQKAQRTGVPFAGSFLRKLAVLLLFGLVHALLFWGDILRWYAVAGLFLLLLHRLRTRTLFGLGVVLTVLAPLGAEVLDLFTTRRGGGNMDWAWLAFTKSSVPDAFRANLAIAIGVVKNVPKITSFVLALIGCFLLGVCAGRLQIFGQALQYWKYFKRGFWLSLILGVGAGVAAFGLLWLRNRAYVPAAVYTDLLIACLFQLNKSAMFVFHVCAIVCAYHNAYVRQFIRWLVYPGRMTLTNYVMQSVIGVGLFYGVGLGLIGKLAPSVTIPLALALFAGQALFSRWWLSRYKVGPLEQLWRNLTQTERQRPMDATGSRQAA